ncbi:MAG: anaerobic ribonucleoside triphosphate reductase [Defluviitaleaceae bacterium]|nr:anaerobic ribonucleoside triphosphate reductase [Defluviitaleaceae bacterium]MCL2836617.1 anaerobic ribonucleoside triphosphate reductase [Defluviitaleaceae bacterium]
MLAYSQENTQEFDSLHFGIQEIVKRDGRRVPYHKDKIVQAIKKAFIAVSDFKEDSYCGELAEEVTNEVYFRHDEAPNVEQIQDVVEEILIKKGHARVAKAFILYRAERTRVREMDNKLMKIYEEITFSESKDSDRKRENANVNGDTAMGTMLKYGSEGAKQYFLNCVLNQEHAKAHQEGDIHIHDMEFYGMTTTCCQIDLKKMLDGGFCTGHGFLREPKDIASYSALACIVIQSNQNDQHGGQSIPNFDYALADGVRKSYVRLYWLNLRRALEALEDFEESDWENVDRILDEIAGKLENAGLQPIMADPSGERNERRAKSADLIRKFLAESGFVAAHINKALTLAEHNAVKETERVTFQAMEALVHNLNTMHSRAGAQTPFSSINYGMDISPEGRMVTKNVLLALQDGLGKGETPIFPIHVFRVKEGVNYNETDISYDLFKLACLVSAKRLFPNFSFQDAPYNLKYYKEGRPETEIAYMGCRTRVIANVNDPNQEITSGRGNLSFTSINLPRIAIKSKGDLKWFYRELDKKMKICIDQLDERFKMQATKKVKNFPFLMGQGVWLDSDNLSAEDKISEVLRHGTLTVGFIGLAECLKSLTGHHHGETAEAQSLGIEIITFMRERLDREAQVKKLNYTLIATPAEGLAGRFVVLDRRLFGEIPGITDRDYYTNSFHIPVYHHISIADKIRLEAPYHALTNAGHITFVELDGDAVKNPEAFMRIIRHMKECGIGYGSINHPVDRDPCCGYIGVIGDNCPSCGRSAHDEESPVERIRRVTGYLGGSLERFNNAKLKEVNDRVKHG